MRITVRSNRDNRVHEDVMSAMEFQDRDEQLNEVLMRADVSSVFVIRKNGESMMYSKVSDAPDEVDEGWWESLMQTTPPEISEEWCPGGGDLCGGNEPHSIADRGVRYDD